MEGANYRICKGPVRRIIQNQRHCALRHFFLNILLFNEMRIFWASPSQIKNFCLLLVFKRRIISNYLTARRTERKNSDETGYVKCCGQNIRLELGMGQQ